MGIIILDINKRQELSKKIFRKKLLSKIKEISSIEEAEIVIPVDEIEEKLRELYRIEHPVYKNFPIDDFNLNKLLESLDLNSKEIIWPYCFESEYWIKFKLINKFDFFNFIYDNGYLKSISIVSLANHKLYDIELGEHSYEIRMNTIEYQGWV